MMIKVVIEKGVRVGFLVSVFVVVNVVKLSDE